MQEELSKGIMTARQDKELHTLILSGGLRRPGHSGLSATRCGRYLLRASNLQAYLPGSQQGLSQSAISKKAQQELSKGISTARQDKELHTLILSGSL